MNMGIGINSQKPDEGQLSRKLEEVACGVWFTSKGTAMPQLIKYQDQEGLIHSISQIRVITREKKYYWGCRLILIFDSWQTGRRQSCRIRTFFKP